MMLFGAVHESVAGPSRQKPDAELRSAFGGTAEIQCHVALEDSDANDPERKSTLKICCDAQRSPRSEHMVGYALAGGRS